MDHYLNLQQYYTIINLPLLLDIFMLYHLHKSKNITVATKILQINWNLLPNIIWNKQIFNQSFELKYIFGFYFFSLSSIEKY